MAADRLRQAVDPDGWQQHTYQRLELRRRMRELARTRVRFGYRRLHVLLRREGWSFGKNLAYRIYWEEGLQLRSKAARCS